MERGGPDRLHAQAALSLGARADELGLDEI
jgi:hypothetical protein